MVGNYPLSFSGIATVISLNTRSRCDIALNTLTTGIVVTIFVVVVVTVVVVVHFVFLRMS
jgi:hypothetical protein